MNEIQQQIMFIDEKELEKRNKRSQRGSQIISDFDKSNKSENGKDIYLKKQATTHIEEYQNQTQYMKLPWSGINSNPSFSSGNQSSKDNLEDQHGQSGEIFTVWMNQEPDKIEISQEQIYESLPNQQQSLENINLQDLLSKSQPIEMKLNTVMNSKLTQFNKLNQSYSQTPNTHHSSQLQMQKKQSSKLNNELLYAELSPEPKNKIKTVFTSIKTYPVKGSTHQQIKVKNQQKNISKLNKSLINHKFHNFYKSSHKSHLKTQSQCFDKMEKRFYYQINKQSSTHNRNKPIKSLNFPLLSTQDQKKMTFQELFSYEKKKMHNTNNILTPSKSDSLFKLQDNNTKIKNSDLKNILNNHYSTNNLWNKKIRIQNDKLPYTSHSKINYLLSLTQKKRSLINQINKCDHEKPVTSASKTQETSFQENNKNGSSVESKQQADSLKKQVKTQNKRSKKLSVSLVTTYNFDYIRKENIQKSEIKQLGRKYLQSSNKKFNKQDLPSSKISIINIRGEQLPNLRKSENLSISQTHTENIRISLKEPSNLIKHNSKTVQIQQIKNDLNKDSPKEQVKQTQQNLNKNNSKVVQIKQIKQKCSRFRKQHTVENEKQKQKDIEMWTLRQKLQPWQNEQFSYGNFPNDFEQRSY